MNAAAETTQLPATDARDLAESMRHLMRKEITQDVVAEAERMLAEGAERAAVAARLGITRYVVRVVARHRNRPVVPPPLQPKVGRRVRNPQRGLDASTIRSIQRMLAVGILPHREIAREAGVSPNTVADVAAGRRKAITMVRPFLEKGERFLSDPIRCSGCHAMISVAPCRACRARQEQRLVCS
jgi:DNA-binding CsgD family transcriptional regulator